MERGSNKEEAKDLDLRVVIFACNWAGISAAENAGLVKIQYSPNIRLVKVVCLGNVSPTHILKAFKYGAHGVILTGCEAGECHYLTGNERCKDVVQEVKELMDILGIEPERVAMVSLPMGEGEQFVKAIEDFTRRIRDGRNGN